MTSAADNTWQFRSIVIVSSLILVGAFVFFVFRPLGILILVSALVALIWTVIVSFRGAKAGQAVGAEERLRVFARTLGSVFVVLIASSIAFVATCFPIGFFTFNEGGEGGLPLWVAFVVGGFAAVIAGGLATRFLVKNHQAKATEKPSKKKFW